jgi:hypothetical protein
VVHEHCSNDGEEMLKFDDAGVRDQDACEGDGAKVWVNVHTFSRDLQPARQVFGGRRRPDVVVVKIRPLFPQGVKESDLQVLRERVSVETLVERCQGIFADESTQKLVVEWSTS